MATSNRKMLDILKSKTRRCGFSDIKDDGSNLDKILDEYRMIAKIASKLLNPYGKEVGEIINGHASEFEFFQECHGNLKSIIEYYMEYLKHERGKEYEKIMAREPRSIQNTSINSLIDSKTHIVQMSLNVHKVRDVYDRFDGIMESYRQRGYQINNYTKHTELGTLKTVL